MQIQMQALRSGGVPPENLLSKVTQAEGNSRFSNRGFAAGSWNSKHEVAQAGPRRPSERLGPSVVRQAGRMQSQWSRCLPLFRRMAGCSSIQRAAAALVRLARLPNPSVNLTRNSVPRWPSEARYANNAPLVQQVTLPRAGYLKR
jgi:hypothetical protein